MDDKPSYEDLLQKILCLESRLDPVEFEVKTLKIREIEHTAILANIPLFMMVVDQERRVKNISKTVSEFTGRRSEEHIDLRGGEALRCVHSLDDSNGCGFGPSCPDCTVRQTVQDTLDTGKSHLKVEADLSFLDDDLIKRNLLVSTTLLKVPNKTALVFIEDITDRKHAEDLVRDLSQRLMQAQERERQMISCELHDGIAQNLSVLKLYCNRLFEDQSLSESAIKGLSEDVSKLLDQTITTVRDLAYDLRPISLDLLGLVPALEIFCEEFHEKNNIRVDFQAAGINELILNSDTQITLYRLVMEGLNNIRKHAAASVATIRLVGAYPDIILRIEDNGKGFDVKAQEHATLIEKRMGLLGMKERVNLVHGQMSIHSQLKKGTEIVINLPLKDT